VIENCRISPSPYPFFTSSCICFTPCLSPCFFFSEGRENVGAVRVLPHANSYARRLTKSLYGSRSRFRMSQLKPPSTPPFTYTVKIDAQKMSKELKVAKAEFKPWDARSFDRSGLWMGQLRPPSTPPCTYTLDNISKHTHTKFQGVNTNNHK